MLYPWQTKEYNALLASYQERPCSALLLTGARYAGREQLVAELVAYLLCLQPVNGFACQQCTCCRLRQEGNHPDYYRLTGANEEGKSSSIKVEQIRNLIDFCSKTPHAARVQVIEISALSELNLNSANALLKILEEPPAHCLFILQSDNLTKILPTLRSRCFKFHLQRPPLAAAQALLSEGAAADFWLRFYEGEPFFTPPLTSEQLHSLEQLWLKPSVANIFSLNNELDPKKIGLAILSRCLLTWLTDLVLLKQGLSARYFCQLQAASQALLPRLNLEQLYNLLEEVSFIQHWSEHPLNHKLQWENLLLRYQQIYV